MGTGTAVATGDAITAAKINLKLESVETADITDLNVSGTWRCRIDSATAVTLYRM